MSKIPEELRLTIARNIKQCRLATFPGWGGGKRCAETFGVKPQQWSPWERGVRTPDEQHMQKLAAFFNVSVEYLRTHQGDYQPPEPPVPSPPPETDPPDATTVEPSLPQPHDHACCPFFRAQPEGEPFSGNVKSMCWLAEQILGDLKEFGMLMRWRHDDIDLFWERYFHHKTKSRQSAGDKDT